MTMSNDMVTLDTSKFSRGMKEELLKALASQRNKSPFRVLRKPFSVWIGVEPFPPPCTRNV